MRKEREIVIHESRNSEFPHPRVWDAEERVDGETLVGPLLVTFDRVTFLNLFSDFPAKFTDEQIEIIREERPYWYNFFKERLNDRPSI